LEDAKVRVHEVVRAGDVATLTKRDVRRQIEAEFGLEFVANNKGAINRTIEEAAGFGVPFERAVAPGFDRCPS
jgi:hypothetical protein